MPQPEPSIGIIDTGAAYTSVDIGLLGRLGVPPTGRFERVSVIDHAPVCKPVYEVSISFPTTNLPAIPMVAAIGINMAIMQQETLSAPVALLGRDVVEKYVFTYNGPLGLFTLAPV